MAEFLQKVEETAPGTWIKARYAFPAPVHSSRKVLDIGDVRLMRCSESSVEIVNFVKDKMLFRLLQYFTENDVLTNAIREWGHPSHVNAKSVPEHVGLSQDCETFVATVGPDTVLFEKGSDGGDVQYKNAIVFSLNNDDITAVAMSSDGCSVVTVAQDGKLVIWKKSKNKWQSINIGKHKEEVTAVAISNCGMYFASALQDNTAVRWKYNGRSWNPSVLQHNADVVGCAIKKCGTFVVTSLCFDEVRVSSEEQPLWKEEYLTNLPIVFVSIG